MFGHPGTISRVRNYFFWCFVVRAGLQCEKIAHVQKPQFFLCFCMVFTYCELCLQATKQRKIIPGACSTELPAKIVLPFRLEMDSGGVWCSLGRHLTGFCSLLGGFWPLLGTSWASLGHFLDALGCLLAAQSAQAENEEHRSKKIGGGKKHLFHRLAPYFRNIFNMRLVTKKPPAMLMVAKKTAAKPR